MKMTPESKGQTTPPSWLQGSAKAAVALLLALNLALFTGCSWTSSLFGSDDGTPEKVQTVEGKDAGTTEPADVSSDSHDADSAEAAAQKQDSDGLVPRPERSKKPTQQETKAQAGAVAQETAAGTAAADKQEKSTAKTTEDSGMPDAGQTAGKQVAAVETPESPKPGEAEKTPPIKAKGVVPIEPSVKSKMDAAPKKATTGKVYYKTTKELHDAIQKAIDAEKFLGYTDPFDAFPVLDGVDTMSAAFIPVDSPNHKVFYHAFFQPTQPFHKRVYGYTVIDMNTNQDYGYFDGNADGVFEQETLDPKIVLDDYLKVGNEEVKEAGAAGE